MTGVGRLRLDFGGPDRDNDGEESEVRANDIARRGAAGEILLKRKAKAEKNKRSTQSR